MRVLRLHLWFFPANNFSACVSPACQSDAIWHWFDLIVAHMIIPLTDRLHLVTVAWKSNSLVTNFSSFQPSAEHAWRTGCPAEALGLWRTHFAGRSKFNNQTVIHCDGIPQSIVRVKGQLIQDEIMVLDCWLGCMWTNTPLSTQPQAARRSCDHGIHWWICQI